MIVKKFSVRQSNKSTTVRIPYCKGLQKCFGFTLTELMIVLSIIGILMSSLFPLGNKILRKAYISIDLQNVHQVALIYSEVWGAHSMPDDQPITSSKPLIFELAYRHHLNNIRYYCSNLRARKNLAVVDKEGHDLGNLQHSDYIFLYPIPSDGSADTTPILFSKGLQIDGTWSSESPYGASGGIIVFLDGHAKFCTNAQEVLVDYHTGEPIQTMQQAVPTGVHAYGFNGMLW
ncbi:MAG: type II secretion system GspH family protein [Opitutales bacterium]|nr:type II secretion system GspH family protein [Opitutales bacterium]